MSCHSECENEIQLVQEKSGSKEKVRVLTAGGHEDTLAQLPLCDGDVFLYKFSLFQGLHTLVTPWWKDRS